MDKIEKAIYNRTELLLGEDVMQEFSRTRVIISVWAESAAGVLKDWSEAESLI